MRVSLTGIVRQLESAISIAIKRLGVLPPPLPRTSTISAGALRYARRVMAIAESSCDCGVKRRTRMYAMESGAIHRCGVCSTGLRLASTTESLGWPRTTGTVAPEASVTVKRAGKRCALERRPAAYARATLLQVGDILAMTSSMGVPSSAVMMSPRRMPLYSLVRTIQPLRFASPSSKAFGLRWCGATGR